MSVESCGLSNQDGCQEWIGKLANVWRTTNDIQAHWTSVMSNLDNTEPLAPLAGPGHWCVVAHAPTPCMMFACHAARSAPAAVMRQPSHSPPTHPPARPAGTMPTFWWWATRACR